jgi:hypothetical protein
MGGRVTDTVWYPRSSSRAAWSIAGVRTISKGFGTRAAGGEEIQLGAEF